jgi:hypothetical protein
MLQAQTAMPAMPVPQQMPARPVQAQQPRRAPPPSSIMDSGQAVVLAPPSVRQAGRARDATELVGGRRPGSAPAVRRKSSWRPVLIVMLVLIAAAVAGVLVALSGPDVPMSQSHPGTK